MSNEIKAAESFAEVTAENRMATQEQWASEMGISVEMLSLLGHQVIVDDVEYTHLGNELIPTVLEGTPISLVNDEAAGDFYRKLDVADLTLVNPKATKEERANNVLNNAIMCGVPYTAFMIKLAGVVMALEADGQFFTDGKLDGPKVDAFADEIIQVSSNEKAIEWMHYAKVLAALGM